MMVMSVVFFLTPHTVCKEITMLQSTKHGIKNHGRNGDNQVGLGCVSY